MSDSLRNLKTKLARAVDIANGDDLPAPVSAVGPDLLKAAETFSAADKSVRAATVSYGKEAPEAQAALSALSQAYDGVREVVLTKVSGYPDRGPSSGHTTPTETIEAAMDLADDLGDIEDAWASDILVDLSPKLEAADKEVDEHVSAAAELQKAKAERAVAAAAAWDAVADFRRVVRRAYGPKSRQYHSLRDRSRSGSADASPEAGA